MSQRLIREMHRILMEDVRGGDQTPGKFRRNQVHIGPEGLGLADARSMPPPPGQALTNAIRDLEAFLQSPINLPIVVRLALIHYQFEAIHPFNVGNGRVGRLLMSLLLCLEDALPQPLLYLSSYLELHRQQYDDHLLAVSQRGAWNAWIEFFLEGVTTTAADAVGRANRLRELRATYHQQVQSARASALLITLVDHLFAQPAVTAAGVRALLSVTPRTAQQHIDRLRDAGILSEVTGQKRNRIYLAHRIIRTLHDQNPLDVPQGQ